MSVFLLVAFAELTTAKLRVISGAAEDLPSVVVFPLNRFVGRQAGDEGDTRLNASVVDTCADLCTDPPPRRYAGKLLLVRSFSDVHSGCGGFDAVNDFETKLAALDASRRVGAQGMIVFEDSKLKLSLVGNNWNAQHGRAFFDWADQEDVRHWILWVARATPALIDTLIRANITDVEVELVADANPWAEMWGGWGYQLMFRGVFAVMYTAAGCAASCFLCEWFRLPNWRKHVGVPAMVLLIEAACMLTLGIVVYAVDGFFATPTLPLWVKLAFVPLLAGPSLGSSILVGILFFDKRSTLTNYRMHTSSFVRRHRGKLFGVTTLSVGIEVLTAVLIISGLAGGLINLQVLPPRG